MLKLCKYCKNIRISSSDMGNLIIYGKINCAKSAKEIHFDYQVIQISLIYLIQGYLAQGRGHRNFVNVSQLQDSPKFEIVRWCHLYPSAKLILRLGIQLVHLCIKTSERLKRG